MKFIPLAFLVLTLLPSHTLAQPFACYVLSGGKQDWNSALDIQTLTELESGRFVTKNGLKCRVFGAWSALVAHSQKNDPPGGQVFIYQESHGGHGGSTLLNDESSNGHQVAEHLRVLSTRSKVAFAASSCYSGDLIKKTLTDSSAPWYDISENVCIISSSVFGSVAYGVKNLRRTLTALDQGLSMEEIFHKVFYGGLISSAPWETVGISDVLKNKALERSLGVLKTMNQWHDSACQGLYKNPLTANDLFRLCLDNRDISYRDFLNHLGRLTYASQDRWPEALAEFAQVKQAMIDNYQKLFNQAPLDDSFLRDTYLKSRQCWENERFTKQTGNDYASQLEAIRSLRECQDASDETESKWSKAGGYRILLALELKLYGLVTSLEKLRALFPVVDERLAPADKISALFPNENGLLQCSPARATELLALILGTPGDMVGDYTPYHFLYAFVRGSLAIPDEQLKASDLKRRQACRNFKYQRP